MKVVKRDNSIVDYDNDKIRIAIKSANSEVPKKHRITKEEIEDVVSYIDNCDEQTLSVEEIQDKVEQKLMELGKFRLAKHYITYRYKRELLRKANTTDNTIQELLVGQSEYWNTENSNKNAKVVTTQRDYIAGIASTDIAKRLIFPENLVKAHERGIIHIHDMDYSAQLALTNCCLINLEDMLQNGTNINGVMIEKPHRLLTATTIATQIITAVASSQYGGTTISLTHLAPFVRMSKEFYVNKYKYRGMTPKQVEEFANEDLRKEIKDAVQTFNYQVNSMSTTNGQAPFLSVNMYLGEDKEYTEEIAMLTEEFLNQRILGLKNSKGVYVTQAFPKLIYVLEEDNIHPDSKYYYLTKLAAYCSAKRLVPDYISEKVMKELKVNELGKGDCYPCMGALHGTEHLYVRINDGEPMDVTIKDLFDYANIKQELIGRPSQLHFPKDRLALPGLGRHNYDTHHLDGEKKSGVYRITYIPEDVSYIGSSSNVQQRWNEHKVAIRCTGGVDGSLCFKDPNLDNYKFEVLKYCDNYQEEEDKYILSTPNCNVRGTSKRYYKVTYRTKRGQYERPLFNESANKVPQSLIDLSQLDIKVYDIGGKWTKIRHIFKNDKTNTPLMMEITYLDNDKKYSISCTEDHPLWTGTKFTRADELVVGDNLYRADGLVMPIINIEWYVEQVDSYDIGTETGTFIGSDIQMHNCRSFLTPDRTIHLGNLARAQNYQNGKPKYYGRFNMGVVTINLVDVALSSKGDEKKFWSLLDKRCEMCRDANKVRIKRLESVTSDVAPILWQYGAFARLDKGEKLSQLLHNGYATVSLGYAGLYECVKYMTGQSHSDGGVGEEFGIKVMQYLNDKCKAWKEEENIDYSVYGSPIESTTYKFAKCLKKRFGVIEGITDRDYITNSYHIPVFEEINAFDKLSKEAKFQKLSPGGAISYVETPNLTNNIEAVLQVIEFIYNNIMYAELNTKSDYCSSCGYDGEMQLDKDLEWYCPNCVNRDHNLLYVTRRTCGYIGTNFWNKGRTQEIKERVIHLDNKEAK